MGHWMSASRLQANGLNTLFLVSLVKLEMEESPLKIIKMLYLSLSQKCRTLCHSCTHSPYRHFVQTLSKSIDIHL